MVCLSLFQVVAGVLRCLAENEEVLRVLLVGGVGQEQVVKLWEEEVDEIMVVFEEVLDSFEFLCSDTILSNE